MKKGLFLISILAAIGIFSHLPHPARDIAGLKPIRAVYLRMDREGIAMETDTGDSGFGQTLAETANDLKSKADGEIFLDTAEFLLLDPLVPITEEFFQILRPTCKVVYTMDKPDMKTVSDYLSIHPPGITLAQLRAAAQR